MARQERFIPGIYNYCDRWCERCDYTHRCRVYRDSQRRRDRHGRHGEDPDDLDVALQDVSRSFAKARRMLDRWAKANDLDLEEMLAEGSADLAERNAERHAETRPAVLAAKRYMDLCGPLLELLRPAFEQAREDAEGRAALMDVTAEADRLAHVRQAFDVLSWDYRLIYVKARRAMECRAEADRQTDDSREFALHDAAGTGHVVRKCLVRSKAALTEIYDWDEALRDRVIELLLTAERVQQAIEEAIPQALEFVWPPKNEE